MNRPGFCVRSSTILGGSIETLEAHIATSGNVSATAGALHLSLPPSSTGSSESLTSPGTPPRTPEAVSSSSSPCALAASQQASKARPVPTAKSIRGPATKRARTLRSRGYLIAGSRRALNPETSGSRRTPALRWGDRWVTHSSADLAGPTATPRTPGWRAGAGCSPPEHRDPARNRFKTHSLRISEE